MPSCSASARPAAERVTMSARHQAGDLGDDDLSGRRGGAESCCLDHGRTEQVVDGNAAVVAFSPVFVRLSLRYRRARYSKNAVSAWPRYWDFAVPSISGIWCTSSNLGCRTAKLTIESR